MSEQVRGIPQDLREFYEFLTQDYFVKQGIGHAEMEIKPILAIIERIARSEQALAALEAQLSASLEKIEKLDAALEHVWKVASVESQVAMDDTAGMEYLSDYTSTIFSEIEEMDAARAALKSMSSPHRRKV